MKPYQPAGLCGRSCAATGSTCRTTGTNLYRRSLYTFWKRTIPPPGMIELRRRRAARPASVRETRTNTPLQALDLMNDVTYRRGGARAGRARDEGRRREPDERASRFAFRLATGRLPNAGESSVLLRCVLRAICETRSAEPRGGAEVSQPGRVAARRASSTSASWRRTRRVASLILNLDETVTKE